MFGCIWDRFVTAWNSVQNGVNWCNYCKSSCHESTSGFFTTNAPNPPHWILNSCFGALHSVWVHLGLFRNCMKLVAKHIKLVKLIQKFVPGSHFVIFRNERIQSTPLDLHSILVYLGSFRNYMKLGAKRGELVQLMQKFVPRSHVGIFRNEPTQSNPLDPKPMFS